MAQAQHPATAAHPAAGATATAAAGDTGPAQPRSPTRTVLQIIMRKGTVGLDETLSVPAEMASRTITLIDHDGTVAKPADVAVEVMAALHQLVPEESAAAKK